MEELAGAEPGDGRAGRATGLIRGLVAPPAAARRLAAEADVLHLPLTVPVPRRRGATVLTLHDLLHHELPALFPAAERVFRRVAYDDAARRATRVVTDSEHARTQIVRRLGVPADRVVAIHLGVDHDRLRPDGDGDAAALAGLDLPPPPWLYYPAALWPHKNHERLLAALAACPPELSLVLSGSDVGGRDALRATAGRLGVAAGCAPWRPHAPVPALYRAATGVVYPSLAEGFGMPPVEAMACGTPSAPSTRRSPRRAAARRSPSIARRGAMAAA